MPFSPQSFLKKRLIEPSKFLMGFLISDWIISTNREDWGIMVTGWGSQCRVPWHSMGIVNIWTFYNGNCNNIVKTPNFRICIWMFLFFPFLSFLFFLFFWALEFLKILASWGLVSYKVVSYKIKWVYTPLPVPATTFIFYASRVKMQMLKHLFVVIPIQNNSRHASYQQS